METRFVFGAPKPVKVLPNGKIKSLLVRCPTTSKLTDTGKTIEEKLWPAIKLETDSFACTHCGQVHTWSKADVVLGRPLSA